MGTEFRWVDGPWPGKLAIAARPRGGDWLEDEIGDWSRSGIDLVLSLLTPQEERSLNLVDEASRAVAKGMKFLSFPIPDRDVPDSESELTAILEKLDAGLSRGTNALVHCRQGIGRTGLVASCLLVTKGLTPDAAIMRVSRARGIDVPETAQQRNWIDHYAAVLAGAK